MKKIASKLSVAFICILLALSLIMGSVFFILYRKYTIDYNKKNLVEKTKTVSDILSRFFSYGVGRNQVSDISVLIRWIKDTEDADAWLVIYPEKNGEPILIATGSGETWSGRKASELPDNAHSVITKALKGETTVTQSFSSVLDTATFTVGSPVYIDDSIIGVVLLHAPAKDMERIKADGLVLFAVSLLISLLLAVLLSIRASLSITKPIRKMKDAAVRLSAKDYSAKTGIVRTDELGELAKAIDSLSDRLAEADKEQSELENMRREYVANVSHDLRTPITVIRSSLEALCDGVVTEKEDIDMYHGDMLRETKVLQDMVNDLLELSRLQNSHFDISHDILSLSDVVNDAVRSAAKISASKNITVKKEIPENPCLFTGDYQRLRQLVLILLENAFKFSEENSETAVNLEENVYNYIITVTDHGCGISEEDIPHVFDRFMTRSSSVNKDGTGLGLAIAKETVSRHNGEITVRSGNGDTVFTVRLPKESAGEI